MINNASLEKRLNEIKKGNKPPEPSTDKVTIIKPEEQYKNVDVTKIDAKTAFKMTVIEILSSLIISIFYGYGLSALIGRDWSFIEMLGVGFILHQLFTLISNIFTKTSNH